MNKPSLSRVMYQVKIAISPKGKIILSDPMYSRPLPTERANYLCQVANKEFTRAIHRVIPWGSSNPKDQKP